MKPEREITIIQQETDPNNPSLIITLTGTNGEELYHGTNFILFIPKETNTEKKMIAIAACSIDQLLHAADTIINLIDNVIED